MNNKLFARSLYKYLIGYGILLFSMCNYALSSYLASLRPELLFEPKIAFIDDKIPFIPAMVIVYIYSLFFWIYGEFVIIRQEDRYFKKATILLFINTIITITFLYAMPTCIYRADYGYLEYANSKGFINGLLHLIYYNDGGNIGYSLFPSFHCSTSICCYLGVKDNPELSKKYKVFALISTLLICLSTVTIKQHYIIDVAGGLLIPCVVYSVINRLSKF